jgi:hypothetical protein
MTYPRASPRWYPSRMSEGHRQERRASTGRCAIVDAVVFDLDGTLVDSLDTVLECYRLAVVATSGEVVARLLIEPT